MKIYLTFIYLLFSLVSFSQKSNTDIVGFDVFCGAGAQTSKEIQVFQKLNDSKNYSAIRKKLFEGTSTEEVLSAILLIEYSSNKLVELTQGELDKINQIAKSERKFSFCFTCTFHEKGTLEQLFAKKRLFPVYELMKRSLLNTL